MKVFDNGSFYLNYFTLLKCVILFNQNIVCPVQSEHCMSLFKDQFTKFYPNLTNQFPICIQDILKALE